MYFSEQGPEFWRLKKLNDAYILEYFPRKEMLDQLWRFMYAFNREDTDIYDCIITDICPSIEGNPEHSGTFMNDAFYGALLRMHRKYGDMKLGYVLPISAGDEEKEVVSHRNHVFTDGIWASVSVVPRHESRHRNYPECGPAITFKNRFFVAGMRCYMELVGAKIIDISSAVPLGTARCMLSKRTSLRERSMGWQIASAASVRGCLSGCEDA